MWVHDQSEANGVLKRSAGPHQLSGQMTFSGDRHAILGKLLSQPITILHQAFNCRLLAIQMIHLRNL